MDVRAELEDRVGIALIRMIRRAEEAQERAARWQGMHPTDFRCLGYLNLKGEPSSPGDIISHLGLTSGAGTALLDRLESAGYITRIRHPEDRRSVLIVLDAVAAAEPLALHERIRAEYQAGMTEFSDGDLMAIAGFLKRIEALSADMNEALYAEKGPVKAAS
ncbi:MarR family transcriptional regulator [Devosia sp.]|jgi:DNA-binding MarR family transcriptional regulator|uniref:MarR family winged helix-turn-helix transcriptional regulator n=1 Tax=Devosia sp. TaxID=1871048 RepID=UPI001ACC0474|nr:MarR family transcriptional regulator [Devosia sp.]MBN9333156.1 MarR family transcriptional regulator [Devosia sp.]